MGKMYWVLDDFNFDGLSKIKIDSKDKKRTFKDSEHITTKMENIVIDDFVVKFTTKPYDVDGTPFSYSLNLTSLEKEFHYKGFAKSDADEDAEIEVEYQSDTIGKYHLDFDGANFLLVATQTNCLAQDKCGIPSEKLKVNLIDLSKNEQSCTPGGKCC